MPNTEATPYISPLAHAWCRPAHGLVQHEGELAGHGLGLLLSLTPLLPSLVRELILRGVTTVLPSARER